MKLFLISTLSALVAPAVNACTGTILHSGDGATVVGRTMEFALNAESRIGIVPAGSQINALASNGTTGFNYTAKYAFTGSTFTDLPCIIDGLNEEGLYFGAFYFQGDAYYTEISDENRAEAVSNVELGNWIMSQYSTTQEVRENLPSVIVVGTTVESLGDIVAPLHYSVVDRSGDAIVIEYTMDPDQGGSRLHIYNNTVNAITNNPPWPYHMTNLRNYVGLQSGNFEDITVGSQVVSGFGQGTGLAGLPGDFTSPSRFVRAVTLANTARPFNTSFETVQQAFHIEESFDIPIGVVPDGETGSSDYTQWTSVSDTSTATYYYKTYLNQQIAYINLTAALENITEVTIVDQIMVFAPIDMTPGGSGMPTTVIEQETTDLSWDEKFATRKPALRH